MARVTHFEISVDDMERAKEFYGKALGWTFQAWDGPMDYLLVSTGSTDEPGIDGALIPRQPGMQTVNIVAVADLDATIAAVTAAGGKTIMPKDKAPGVGYFAYFTDTEGNAFGAMQPDPSVE